MESTDKLAQPDLALSRLRRLEAQFLKPYRGWLLLGLVGMLVQSLLMLPVPLLQGRVLDRLVALFEQSSSHAIAAPDAASAFRLIVLVLAVTVACHLTRMGLAWGVGAMMAGVSQEVIVALTDALHRKLQRLPMSYFDRQQTGRIMARLTSDVGSILVFLSSGFLQLITDLILAVAISVILVWLQWRLALISFVAVPLYVVNHKYFSKALHRLSREVRAQVAALYALLSERVSAVRVVRSFAKESAEVAELDSRIDTHRELSWANTRTSARQSALATLISGTGTVLVVSLGALLIGRGQLTVGELLAFYAFVGQLYNPIVRLTQFQQTATGTLVSIERMYEIFDEPETVTDRPGARPIVRPRGELEFRNVSFTYTPGGTKVLDRINLAIEPGMTVGVLGASGSGKSTLLSLAPRLYDVPEGSGTVLFDGQDVRDLRLADLRHTVALVTQQPILFEGTIRSNLLYAAPQASADEIERALEASDFATTVAAFPLGLETPVGERGLSLSGGQRQRLALARAMIADPSVLLLDDCTSALDAETESRIQTALEELLPGRTRVIVSHKVSSVRHADWIVVLDRGRIVEQGTHDDLLDHGGVYADTHEQQTHALAI